MDAFPSVDTLISGSKSPTGITANWDVVVSYSLAPLNSVLQRLWVTTITSTTIQLVTESYNEDDEKYYTQWWLELGAPALQFTTDGRASLSMPLNGKRQVQGLTPDGKDRPIHEIPKDMYALFAVIPLGVVSATSTDGSTYEFKGKAGQVIRFDTDLNSKLHIVFNFQTTQAEGAVYSIGYAPGKPPPPSPIPDDLSVGLREKLAAWISDPNNVSAIQYALAVVGNNPVPGATYLTPQSISFSVYSSQNKPDVGCLSIYMQTQNSGFEPGNTVRSFTLPASDNMNTYPIPSGYTASIIIRHDLFAQKFLRDTMVQLKQSGKNAFRSITLQPSSEGLALMASMNSTAVADLAGSKWFGGSFDVDKINWDFGANNLTLTIKDSKCSWNYSFNPRLEWREAHVHSFCYGKTNYEMKLNQSGLPLFYDATDSDLQAKIEIQASYWERNATAWQPGFWDRVSGASGSVPSEIEDGLAKIELPTFSGTLDLGYFATTNIFAPGKHMLSVSSASHVYTPYDIIILGNVVETVTTNPPYGSGTPVTTPITGSTSKNTTDLINDLANGRPILRQLTAAALSSDSDSVDNVMQARGYKITDSDVSDALKAADAGPTFDIRYAAGLYSFDKPADLKTTEMTIDPASARVYLDKTPVNNTTDADGNVTWTSSGYTYSISFITPFNSKGSVDPITFSGTRTSSGSIEKVSGTQVKPKDASEFFTNTAGGLTAGWIASVFGACFSVYVWLAQKNQERQQAAREAIHEAVNDAQDVADIQAAETHVAPDTIDQVMATHRNSIEAEIRSEGVQPGQDGHPAVANAEIASNVAKGMLKSLVRDVVKPGVVAKLAAFENFLGSNGINGAISGLVDSLFDSNDVLNRFNPDSAYILDVLDSQKARLDASAAREKESSTIAAQQEADARVQASRQDLEAQRIASEARKKVLIDEGKTEKEIEADEQMIDIQKKIKEREAAERVAQVNYDEAARERAAAEKERMEYDEEEREANEKAEEEAKETYKPVHY